MNSLAPQRIAMPGWLTVCGALFAVLLLTQMMSLRHKGLTTDEPLHYQYGNRVLQVNLRDDDQPWVNASTMPFSSVHAMTSMNLAVFALNGWSSARHFLERSNEARPLRDHCSFRFCWRYTC